MRTPRSTIELRPMCLQSPVLEIRAATDGCVLPVRVQPRARRNQILGEFAGALKISLTAPPVEGQANAACIEFLSKLLKLPRSSFSIAAGETSGNKLVRVIGLSPDELRLRLRGQWIVAGE